MAEGTYIDANQMIKIDGGKIRRLRESKGLTQLYIATYVGVTTDTISRWENKRYQTIKRGNAVKLAEALEIDLEGILDTEQVETETSDSASEKMGASPPVSLSATGEKKRFLPFLFIAAVLFVFFLAGIMLFTGKKREIPVPQVITAYRLFPSHCTPNSLFPVSIRVSISGAEPVSLIIREELPAGLKVVQGKPPFTAIDNGGSTIKWLAKATQKETTFLYLCKTPSTTPAGHKLYFSGTVTQKQMAPVIIEPQNASLEIEPFHWADTNKDLKISDEEILSVYDNFSEFEGMGIDFDLIEEIWSANGYRWDEKRQQFIVVQ